MGCNWRSKVRGFPQGFPQFFDVFNRLWRLIGIVAKYFLAETLDFYAVCDPSLWQVAGSGTNIELHLRTKRGMASFFEGSSEFVNLVTWIYLGVSENSVPLNPMVLLIIIPIKWLFHWEYTQHFQTNPLHTSHAIASVLSFPNVTLALPSVKVTPDSQSTPASATISPAPAWCLAGNRWTSLKARESS